MAQKIPKHIQGIIQQSKGGQYKFGQIEMPELKQGDLLIKVHAAPINPSDIGFIKGTYPSNDFPTILGKEGSGFVIAGYGEQEQKLIGKKVAFLPKASSRTGTYADYAISTINSSFILPDDVNLDQFSCVLINPQTVAYMFETVKENNVKAVVHDLGASQLGKQMTSYFQANGVDVINIVRRQDQLEDLKKNGAKYILNQNDEGFWDKLSELCQKLQVTIAFDAIGGEFTQNLINYLPNSSILYTYGSLAEKKDVVLDFGTFRYSDKQIRCFWLPVEIQRSNEEKKQRVNKIVNELIFTKFQTQISNVYSYKQLDDAIQYYQNNMSSGKVLIKPIE